MENHWTFHIRSLLNGTHDGLKFQVGCERIIYFHILVLLLSNPRQLKVFVRRKWKKILQLHIETEFSLNGQRVGDKSGWFWVEKIKKMNAVHVGNRNERNGKRPMCARKKNDHKYIDCIVWEKHQQPNVKEEKFRTVFTRVFSLLLFCFDIFLCVQISFFHSMILSFSEFNF